MSTPASPLHSTSPRGAAALPAWKQEANERLREHRRRRGAESPPAPAAPRNRVASPSAVAARVAERYREAPSYRDLLESSAAAAAAVQAAPQAALAAEQATQQAAEQATPHNAQAASAALPNASTDTDLTRAPSAVVRNEQPSPYRSMPVPGFSVAVEHLTPLPQRSLVPRRKAADREVRPLVDAFAEALVPAAQNLPAKLIEFPRELIAHRRQRPRLAEGPLHDEQSPASALRIFEVNMPETNTFARRVEPGREGASEPARGMQAWAADATTDAHGVPVAGTMEEVSVHSPSDLPADMTPEIRREPLRRAPFLWEQEAERARDGQDETGWSPLELGAHPENSVASIPVTADRPEPGHQAEDAPLLQDLATVGDRLMAALVDASVVFACFLLSVLVFVSCTVYPPAGKSALLGGALFLGALAAFYGWLFLSFGGGSTPGMRYSQIALCTFADENPSRRELQQRIPATALALLPLGLGVLWALLDEDRLGWQDRMTRTYQRSYRRSFRRSYGQSDRRSSR